MLQSNPKSLNVLILILEWQELNRFFKVLKSLLSKLHAKNVTLLHVISEELKRHSEPFPLSKKTEKKPSKNVKIIYEMLSKELELELKYTKILSHNISHILHHIEEIEQGHDLLIQSGFHEIETAELIAENSLIPVLTIKRESDFKKFLVCTDGSHYANKAVEYSTKIAKIFNAEITLLSVARDENEVEKRKHALESGEKIFKELSFKNYKIELRRGRVSDTIINESAKYDLVILGPRGLSKIKKIIMGHISLNVLKKSSTNVLLVR